MVKIIAGILLFFGCTALGFSKASGYKNRRVELEDTLELIRLLHLDISYRKDALAKTFQRAALQKSCWFADVLQECAEGLTAQKTLGKTWQDALYKEKEGCPLLSEDVEILTDLFLGLGRSDTRGQQQILEPVLYRLEQQICKAQELEYKMGKMYRSLGLAAGVVAAILVL